MFNVRRSKVGCVIRSIATPGGHPPVVCTSEPILPTSLFLCRTRLKWLFIRLEVRMETSSRPDGILHTLSIDALHWSSGTSNNSSSASKIVTLRIFCTSAVTKLLPFQEELYSCYPKQLFVALPPVNRDIPRASIQTVGSARLPLPNLATSALPA